MDAVGAVGARRKYREAPTPNEAGGGTCMLEDVREFVIPRFPESQSPTAGTGMSRDSYRSAQSTCEVTIAIL